MTLYDTKRAILKQSESTGGRYGNSQILCSLFDSSRRCLHDYRDKIPAATHYRKDARYDCEDFDDEACFHDSAAHSTARADETNEFYGGILFGDGKIYMSDDDDFIDKFGNDVL